MRVHRKVWLWWGTGWAVQLYRAPYISLGIHVDFRRPYVDLHVGWFIFSVGNRPISTDERDRKRHTCRGFLFADDPVL